MLILISALGNRGMGYETSDIRAIVEQYQFLLDIVSVQFGIVAFIMTGYNSFGHMYLNSPMMHALTPPEVTIIVARIKTRTRIMLQFFLFLLPWSLRCVCVDEGAC